MNKKGFTLIELVGIIAILSLILIVTIPALTSTLSSNTVKKVDSFHHDLELAAQSYVENNWSSFKSQVISNASGEYCLKVAVLINNKYVSATEIDPETNAVLNPNGKYILLTKVNSDSDSYRFSFTYVKPSSSADKCWGV